MKLKKQSEDQSKHLKLQSEEQGKKLEEKLQKQSEEQSQILKANCKLRALTKFNNFMKNWGNRAHNRVSSYSN